MGRKVYVWSLVVAAVAVGSPAARAEGGAGGAGGAGRATLTAAPILGGQDTSDETNVVQFSSVDSRVACSAVVVAPNLVLTARHCLAQANLSFNCEPTNPNGGGFELGALAPADQLRVYLSPTFLVQPRGVAPDAFGKKVFSDPVANLCGHDVAIVLLDRDLPGRRRLPLRLTPSRVDEPMRAVGWGVINTRGQRPTQLQSADVSVLALGPANYELVPGMPLVTTLEREMVVSKSGCTGDSGSPLLSKETGAVVATFSYITNVYPEKNEILTPLEPAPWCSDGAVGVYHSLEGREFLAQAFAEAGHKLWREGEPEPLAFGQGCTLDDQCDSGVCAGPPGAAVCSQVCDASGGCPAGLQCVEAGGRRVCASGEVGGGAGGGVVTPPTNEAKGGGDGCQAGGRAASGAPWAAAGALLGLALRRRGRSGRRGRAAND